MLFKPGDLIVSPFNSEEIMLVLAYHSKGVVGYPLSVWEVLIGDKTAFYLPEVVGVGVER